jgi:ribosomal protein S4E
MVHVKDAMGHTFNTRLENVFVIGDWMEIAIHN